MSQEVASLRQLGSQAESLSSKNTETGISVKKEPSPFKQRLLKKDRSRFNKYIQSTTTHGVVYIFIGKSKIRRLFWLMIVTTAAVGCLFNVSNRIIFLANGPTSTRVSIIEADSVNFPAVTLCNLNLIRRSYLESVSPGLAEFVRNVFYSQGNDQICRNDIEQFEPVSMLVNESFPDLLWRGRHTAEDTIFICRFKGQECSWRDFVPVLTPSGVCYSFNSGKRAPLMTTNGTGIRFALSLIVSIEQHEYNAALNQDAGIKISIHPHTEPPQPDELGIAIPPGKNAFIGVKQRNILNKNSNRKCRDESATSSFNFLHGEFPYSVPACQSDCLRSNIAKNCGCFGSGIQAASFTTNPQFHSLKNCTIEDICCQIVEVYQHDSCDCPVACSRTQYTTGISYSAFPANYAARDLADSVNSQLNTTITTSVFQENFLGINIYFETLSLEEQVTDNAYDIVALLSDIGGQLGLFLGASVISVFEFLTWIFDEVKDRCCGISERKIIDKVKSSTAKCVCKWRKGKSQVIEFADENQEEDSESDGYKNYETM
jgi:hypothetical protein